MRCAMRLLLLFTVVSGACAHAEKQSWSDAVESSPAVVSTPAAHAVPEPETREPPPPIVGERCRWPVEPVRMDMVRADVRQVLQALADRANINLVLTDDVTGQVTVRLDDVPLDRALVTIAQAAGLALDTDRCVTTVGPRPRR